MNEWTDERLVVAWVAGKHEVFSVLYDRYRDQLVAYLLETQLEPWMRGYVDVIVMKTWERVIDDYGQGRLEKAKASFSSYVFDVARNVAVDHCRVVALSKSNSDVAKAFASSEGKSPLEVEELQEKVRALLEGLSSREQAIARLCLSGISSRRIAYYLQMSERDVTTRWKEIRRKLPIRAVLQDGSGDPPGDARQIEVFLDPGGAPATLITEFYIALDSLYRACGGSGLRIVKDEQRMCAAETVR